MTRFIEGSPVSDAAVHSRETIRRVADSLRRIHDGPAIPGLFVPLRIVEAYRALAVARGVPIPPEYDLAPGDRPADRAGLPGRSGRAAAVPQRPAQRQLHRRRRAHPDRRLGVRRDGRPVLRPGQLQHQPRARRPDEDRRCSRPTTARPRGRDRLARLTLMRVVSDFREAMWGVLQQGDQHARRRLRRVRRRALRPPAVANASTPAFERALREAAGD